VYDADVDRAAALRALDHRRVERNVRLGRTPNPIVTLNRAVAVATVHGPQASFC